MSEEDFGARNLRQLERRFASPESPAARGAALIDRLPDPELAHLLRSHLVSGISDAETKKRDDVDELLAYYGLLEVASIANCIPEPLPPGLRAAAIRQLARPALKRYYENLYPLVLPRLFREGVGDGPTWHASTQQDHTSLFMTFLQISGMIEGEPVETFLWFLDAGQTKARGKWWSLADFLRTLSDPEQFVRVLTRPLAAGPLERSLQGFVRFLAFARTLDNLLRACTDPLLQSAFWHHHAYWFQQIGGQVGGVIAVAIELQRDMVGEIPEALSGRPDAAQEQEWIGSTLKDMDQAQDALRRLTSAFYRAPLERAALGSDFVGVSPALLD